MPSLSDRVAAAKYARAGKTPPPWRPPTRVSRSVHTRRLITAVAVSVLLSVVSLTMFARFASRHASEVKLANNLFEAGRVSALTKRIDAKGPLFFNDLVREDGLRRPLVLTHVADDDFAALNAVVPGSTAGQPCLVTWNRRSDPKVVQLVDSCTGDVYDAAGIGPNGKRLDRFSTEVTRSNVVIVDLNKPYPEALRTSS